MDTDSKKLGKLLPRSRPECPLYSIMVCSFLQESFVDALFGVALASTPYLLLAFPLSYAKSNLWLSILSLSVVLVASTSSTAADHEGEVAKRR